MDAVGEGTMLFVLPRMLALWDARLRVAKRSTYEVVSGREEVIVGDGLLRIV